MNENRFNTFKEPQIWTKTKHIAKIDLKRGKTSQKARPTIFNIKNEFPNTDNYHPNKEPTMVGLVFNVPNYSKVSTKVNMMTTM